MFTFRQPDPTLIAEVVQSQHEADFTYEQVGYSREFRCPPGFHANQSSQVIGRGEEEFARAKQAFVDFQMLKLGWLEAVATPDILREGEHAGVMIRTFGLYSLNVARIVYVEDSADAFGFGYGTLPEYPLAGEEQFRVYLNRQTEEVTYDIFSFSRPTSLLARIGWLFVRQVQKRFCIDSTAAMRKACNTMANSG